MKNKILVIGDIHFPYHNKQALSKVYAAIKKEQPTHVVQIGDLFDQYTFSRYTKKAGQLPPEKELYLSRKLGLEFWNKVQSLAPKAKCFQLLGNHDIRLSKKVADKLPEVTTIIDQYVKELYTFPGVKTMNSSREELYIGDIMFIHGYLSKLGDHSKKNISKVVVGHSHVGGAVFYQYKNKTLWELNAGYLADDRQVPLQYGEQQRKSWTLGYGLIDQFGPRFIPLK